MEKKTMGNFIAVLRKANGMTQKDLAERLNVSDKAVSRWERDENAPDLSLIPVIAEVFGITVDELLRGERTPASETADDAGSAERMSAKGEKQMKHLIHSCQTKFHIHSTVAFGIALLGLIATMIGNFGFIRAYIGFFAGCVFYLTAIISESIFYRIAVSSMEETQGMDLPVRECRIRLFRMAEKTYSIIFVIFAFSLPLVTVVQDTYMGIDAKTWVQFGAVYGAAALVLSVLVCILVNQLATQRVQELSEEQQYKLGLLRKKALFLCGIVLIGTMILQIGFHCVVKVPDFCEGQKFDDYDNFVEFMELEDPGYSNSDLFSDAVSVDSEGESASDPGKTNAAELQAAPDEENLIKAADGTVLCTYVWNNKTVVQLEYGEEENGYLPITVYTSYDFAEGERVLNRIHFAFIVLYFLELAVTAYIYKRKSSTIMNP